MSQPLPRPTPDTQPYWDAVGRHELQVPQCLDCLRAHFYPRPTCPHCHSDNLQWMTCSGKAKLVSFIINRRPLPSFQLEGPQIIALVELEEGVRMTTNLVDIEADPSTIQFDMPLEVRYRQVGEQVLPAFAPEGVGR